MKEAHDASTDFGEPKEEDKDNKFKTGVSLEDVNLTGGNTNQACQRTWKKLTKREVRYNTLSKVTLT